MKTIFLQYLPILGKPGEGLHVYRIPAEEPLYVGCHTAFSPLSKMAGGRLEFSSVGRAIGYLKKYAKMNGVGTGHYFIYPSRPFCYRIASFKNERQQCREDTTQVVTLKDIV